MDRNLLKSCSDIDIVPKKPQDYRLMSFTYDHVYKKNTRKCFSPPVVNRATFRNHSIPRFVKRESQSHEKLPEGTMLTSVNPDMLTQARHLVNEAISKKKIFTIIGPYDKIRQVLKSRGWVEKITDGKAIMNLYAKLNEIIKGSLKIEDIIAQELQYAQNKGYVTRKDIINTKLDYIASLLVLNCTPDLIWSLRSSDIDDRNVGPDQIINHYKKVGSFTTKIGLMKIFNYLCWYEKSHDDIFPRSYILTDDNERKAFLDNYYLTACMSLIKLTAETVDKYTELCDGDKVCTDVMSSYKTMNKVRKSNNNEPKPQKLKIDKKYPEMAIRYCESYLKNYNNKDLDQIEIAFCSARRWEEFFDNFYNVTKDGYEIDCTESLRLRCQTLCNEMKNIHSQFHMDGTKNIWIIKPGAKSRGRGILCVSKFSEINAIIRMCAETLIVQKYIERPLLVYETKFDIRQWFLVTSWSPLTIWWYKDCYIRFCSQQFTLNDLNESVHLSNNTIQHKYKNGDRSSKLPWNNMWEWIYFEKYLNDNNFTNAWQKKILPSMKDIIIDVLLCSQEDVIDRKNSFELYGADFMVTDDIRTWLIEINSSPCMSPTTNVTAKLTKTVMEDVIKVLLDYPENNDSDTGKFELLFKQSPFTKPVIEAKDKLILSGIGIKKPATYSHQHRGDSRQSPSKKILPPLDNSILRNKLRHVIESNVSCSAMAKVSQEKATSEYHVKDLEEYWKENRNWHQRSRSFVDRYSRGKLLPKGLKQNYMTTRLTSPIIATELNRGSRSFALSYHAIGSYNGDESSERNNKRQDMSIIKSIEINKDKFLMEKIQYWNDIDKKQGTVSTTVKLRRYI